MKYLLPALALSIALPGAALAQGVDTTAIAAQQAAMTKLAPMRGVWRGTAVSQQAGAPEHRITQTERIGTFLDGTLTLIEGKGYEADGKVSFHAFGVISYDPATQKYWLTSNAQGRSGKFPVWPSDTGFVWEIPAGPAVIRYTATITPTTWVEVGDYVAPNAPPRRFFRMELTRLGDTNWPEAGGVPRE
jgi:hypothetical protein